MKRRLKPDDSKTYESIKPIVKNMCATHQQYANNAKELLDEIKNFSYHQAI